MIDYDWIDVSEGFDIKNTGTSKCIVCHFWYF